jgi:hypothetical protein
MVENIKPNFISEEPSLAALAKKNFEESNYKTIANKSIIVYAPNCDDINSCVYDLTVSDEIYFDGYIRFKPGTDNLAKKGTFAEIHCSTQNNVDWTVNNIHYFTHEIFRLTPIEWAISTLQNSKLKENLIKNHQIELAHSIIFWNTHAYYNDKQLIHVNKFNKLSFYKRNDIVLFRSENNIGQQLIDPMFKHYVYWAKENPNTFESTMIMFWKNKFKYNGE